MTWHQESKRHSLASQGIKTGVKSQRETNASLLSFIKKEDINKDKIKFNKHGLKINGKYIRAWYSEGKLIDAPEGTITIYAKDYGNQLPKELNPQNYTDSQTDYFDKDKARIRPDNKYYKEIKKIIEENRKIIDKRMIKKGYGEEKDFQKYEEDQIINIIKKLNRKITDKRMIKKGYGQEKDFQEYEELVTQEIEKLGMDRSDAQGIIETKQELIKKSFDDGLSVKKTSELVDKSSRR